MLLVYSRSVDAGGWISTFHTVYVSIFFFWAVRCFFCVCVAVCVHCICAHLLAYVTGVKVGLFFLMGPVTISPVTRPKVYIIRLYRHYILAPPQKPNIRSLPTQTDRLCTASSYTCSPFKHTYIPAQCECDKSISFQKWVSKELRFNKRTSPNI